MPDAAPFPSWAPILDHLITEARDALLEALPPECQAELTCACADPQCPNRAPDGWPYARLLEGTAAWALPPAWPSDGLVARARATALVLTRWLGILPCPCGEPQCASEDPHALSPAAFWMRVRQVWGVAIGCRHGRELTADSEGYIAELRVEQTRALERFAAEAPRLSVEDHASVQERFSTVARTRLFREADVGVAHGVRDWYGPDWQSASAVRIALAAAQRAAEAAASPGATPWWLATSSYAVHALRMHRLAHPYFTGALYLPYDAVGPLARLLPEVAAHA